MTSARSAVATSRSVPDADVDPPHWADLRTVPLAAVAWAAAFLGTSGSRSALLAAGLGVVLVLGVGWWRHSVRLVAVAIVGAAVLAGGALHARSVHEGPVAQLATHRAVARVEVRLTADPQAHPAKGPLPAYRTQRGVLLRVAARGDAYGIRTPVLLVLPDSAAGAPGVTVPVGTTVATTVRLAGSEPDADVAAIAKVQGAVTTVSPPSAGLRAVERVRVGLRSAVAHRLPDQRALVPALVLGDTAGLTPELVQRFQTTGLTHLTAVSGANLTLLLAFLLLAARWAGVRGWWLRWVAVLGVVVFVALCRTEPSVLRAAAMGLVALAALGAGSRRAGLRNLATAGFILLLVDPWLGRSLGFVLSVLASAGIVVWARPWSERLGRWCPGPIAEAVAVPLAAHLATLPVVAAISGRISVVGLGANAAAGPFVGPATVLGFAAAGLSLLSPPAAALAGFGAAWSTQPILTVAALGAEAPGAAWDWQVTPSALVLLSVLALVIGLAVPYVLRSRALTLVLAALLVVSVMRPPLQVGWPPSHWVLVACDVGQGDGLVLRVSDREAMVVDVGPDPQLMDRCLAQLHVAAVPVLVLTHFHSDHVAGLAAVLRDHRVGMIWTGSLRSPPGEAARVLQLATAAGVPVRTPPVGESVTTGELTWTTIGPLGTPDAMEGESSVQNDSSLVGLVQVDGIRVLMTGDVEPDGQRALLAAGADLRADVLKVPHHGSSRQDRSFFAATGARVAVVSAGLDNGYGHPAPATVALVGSLGMTLLRTDTEGSVAVTVDHGKLAAVAARPIGR